MSEQYIKAGWESYLKLVVPADASEGQVADTRNAFFCGACVLFQLITRSLDPGTEATERDLQYMTDISDEVTAFGQELDRKMLGITTH